MVITTLMFLFGAVASTLFQFKLDPFLASRTQFAVAALVIVILVIAAFLIPVRRRNGGDGSAPSPWIAGAVALLFGSAALFVPQSWGWGAAAELLGLDLVMFLAVLAWSRRAGWGIRHQLALGAGAALAYGWHAFLQHPAVGVLDPSVRVGNAIFLAAALALIWFAATRVSRFR